MYLTIQQFIDRFGETETIRLTDEEGDGTVGEIALMGAIAAASEVVNAYVSARYVVPLDPVPALIRDLVADLAHARLYPRGAPEGVASAAKDAERKLEQISKGVMRLPSVAALPAAPSSSPVLISPGTKQYPDGLKDY